MNAIGVQPMDYRRLPEAVFVGVALAMHGVSLDWRREMTNVPTT